MLPASDLIRRAVLSRCVSVAAWIFPARGWKPFARRLWARLNFVARMPQITREVHGMRELRSNTPFLSPRGYSQLSPFQLSRAHRFVFSFARGDAMKRIVLASICVVGFVGSAIAADLGPAVKAPLMARPGCAQFGGWYVGANVGYGYLQHNFQDRDFLAGTIDTGLP